MSRRVVSFAVVWTSVGSGNLFDLTGPHAAIDSSRAGGDAAIDAAAPDFQSAVATPHPRVAAGGFDFLTVSVAAA
jgi:hypothetical protein